MIKDDQLRYFEAHGKFPGMADKTALSEKGADGADAWVTIGGTWTSTHLAFNGVLLAHTSMTLLLWKYAFGLSPRQGLGYFAYAALLIMAVHGVSHFLGMLRNGGQSRDSLVGETAIKEGMAMAASVFKSLRKFCAAFKTNKIVKSKHLEPEIVAPIALLSPRQRSLGASPVRQGLRPRRA